MEKKYIKKITDQTFVADFYSAIRISIDLSIYPIYEGTTHSWIGFLSLYSPGSGKNASLIKVMSAKIFEGVTLYDAIHDLVHGNKVLRSKEEKEVLANFHKFVHEINESLKKYEEEPWYKDIKTYTVWKN